MEKTKSCKEIPPASIIHHSTETLLSLGRIRVHSCRHEEIRVDATDGKNRSPYSTSKPLLCASRRNAPSNSSRSFMHDPTASRSASFGVGMGFPVPSEDV